MSISPAPERPKPGPSAPSTSLWQQAVERYEGLLNEAEKDRFGRSGPDDIVREVQAAQHSREQSSKVQVFLRKIQPFVQAIERFGKPLDVFANASEVMSPVWGTLRVILIIARDYESYFSKLVEMLQQIADVMPSLQVYEQLFHNHQTLREALSAVYLEIIAFLVQAKKIFSGRSSRLLGQALWKTFEQTFVESLTQFRRHSQLVEREARLAHWLEEDRARQDLARMKSLIEEQTSNVPGLVHLKHWLGARQPREERDEVKIAPGTCEWILKQPELLDWVSQERIRLFWLSGAAGCGKSFLYCKLLEYIETKAPVVYFFFCGADGKRLTLLSLLGSWAFQLAKIFPQAMRYVKSTMQLSENREATLGEVRNLFVSLLEILPSCYLTVDAIDECLPAERVELYRLLLQIPERFKVLMTSRPLLDLSNHLQKNPYYPFLSLEITEESTKGDICKYITQQLAINEQQYRAQLVAHINRRLTDSGGMFLWTRLMLEHIQNQTCEEEIIQCLDELPKSLSERYDQIMAHINSLPERRRLLAHKVFFWILIARRPLAIKELSPLLAVRPGSDSVDGFNPALQVMDPDSKILDVCGALITARGQKKTLYPIHFTVTEYLKDYINERSNTLTELTAFYQVRQLKCSESLAAAVCMRYLSLDMLVEHLHDRVPAAHSDVEALSCAIEGDVLKCLGALFYASTHWSHHLAAVEDPSQLLLFLAAELLDDSRQNREICWRLYWFSGPDSSQSAICPANFSPLHTAVYFGLDCLMSSLLPKWDPETLDGSGRTALWWAATLGNTSATRLLVDVGADANRPDIHSISPAHRAAATDNSDAVELFLSVQGESDPSVTDGEGWTPLHWAAARGHSKVVAAILHYRNGRRSYGTRRSQNRSGRTPLHLAAFNGQTMVIPELAGHDYSNRGCFINLRDSNGQTALHLAAFNGHVAAVETMLKHGADTTVRDHSGKTPADKASEMGNGATISVLAGNHRAEPEEYLAAVAADIASYDLQSCIMSSNTRIIKKRSKDQLNSRDAQDSSLLHAVINNHRFNLKMLVEKGRRWFMRDERGRNLLHHAAAVGSASCTSSILNLAAGYDDYVNQQDDRGWTPLHYAVTGSYDAIVKLLLQAGASVSVSNIEGATSYDVALKERQCGTVEALVRYGRMPTSQVSQNMGWNGIHRKARDGTITLDEAARADRDALIARDTFGRIPMYRALEMGHWEPAKTLMLALLDKEINLPVSDLVDLATVVCEHLNPASIKASTILHELLNGLQPFSLPATSEDVHARAQQLLITVVEQNDLDSIAALLRAGVCLDTRRSFNPVETAICSGSVGAAIHLIEYGTGVHFPDPSCSTSPLHAACRECMPEVAKLLLEKGADPNGLVQSNHDNSVSTPLQFLILGVGEESPEGSLRCAELLLDHGATVVGVENLKGDSPAWEIMSGLFESQDSAPWRGLPAWWQSMADLIASRGFAMLTRPLNESGLAPIHLAVESGDVDALEQELDAGVPVDWKSFKYPRKRPLQIAVEKDNADMVAVLLQYGAAVDGEFDLGGGRKHATRGVATEVKSEEVRRLLLEVQRRELAGW